jgi:hypothetical protein
MDPLLAAPSSPLGGDNHSNNNTFFQRFGTTAGDETVVSPNYDDGDDHGEDDDLEGMPTPMVRGWSFQEGRRSTATTPHKPASSPTHHHYGSTANRTIPIGAGGREAAAATATATATAARAGDDQSPNPGSTTANGTPNNTATKRQEQGYQRFLSYIVYAFVNVIISAPGLYGYTAVIFNHHIFQPHMNALSKLVIFSSLIHQLGFLLFSSLDFAIGTVQDAGLIFLSSMAHTIAKQMLMDGHSEEEILSTTCVLLSLGTAALGVVLVLMGKFRLADAVSYLPMPVIGGYLAFIGYFCCQAGIALCISKPLVSLSDWQYVIATKQSMTLVAPGLIAGLVLTLTSRWATNASVLPLTMVAIPALFYIGMYVLGMTMEEAREEGWIGTVAPPVPIGDLFQLIDFQLVRWDMITHLFGTWIGMVFVVSFASCLDVAAISLDMGEALDTNRELATVGICNGT